MRLGEGGADRSWNCTAYKSRWKLSILRFIYHEFPYSGGGTSLGAGCEEGEVIQSDGTCAGPVISRKLYLFEAPEPPHQPTGPPSPLPRPKVNENHIYVRVPGDTPTPEPVVIPPPRRKTLVYVLKKVNERTQRVIEVKSIPSRNPQVYFINYQDGENPSLPIGIHIDTSLDINDDVVRDSGGKLGDSVGLAGSIRRFSVGLGKSTSATFSNNGVLIAGTANRQSRNNTVNRGFISRSLTPSGLYSRTLVS
ncbi:uncharacterized protein LOC134770732 [Penaeus indicus]|uniref:uncharacterized protein LOC134770732 n=1 Tax=Penaeus indicus TaxID=29960 RepID=UPI00300C6D94